MILKLIFKNLKISYKKMNYLVKKIRGFSLLNMLIYLKFLNKKSAFLLNKLLLISFSCFRNKLYSNFFNFNIDRISSEKSLILRRPMYRAKGRFDILKKRYCNLLINFSNNNGSKSKSFYI